MSSPSYVDNGSVVGGGGGASLPPASGAGELLRSTGAGDDYEAVDQTQVLADSLSEVLGGEPVGTAILSDGAGDVTASSAAVSALLASADASGMRSALSLGGAAVLNVGATTSTVAAGDDSRITGAVQNTTTVAGAPLSADVSAATILAALLASRTDTIPLTVSPGRWTLTAGSGASTASIDTAAQSLDLVVAASTASISFAVVVPDAAKIPDLWNFTMRARIKTFTASGSGREVFARMGLRFSSGARVYLSAYDGTVAGGVEVYVSNGNTTTPQRLYTAAASTCPLDGTGWLEIQFANGVCGFRVGIGVGSAVPTTWKTMGSVVISTTDGATAASPTGWPSLQDVTLQAITNNTSGGLFTVKWSDISLRSAAGLL